MLKIILVVFLNFIFIPDDCEKYSKALEALERINGEIKSIDTDETQNLIVFELSCNDTTKRIELLNTASSQRLYKYAKIGDKFNKDKGSLRITIIRIMSPMHVQARYFDITCDDSE